MASAAMASAPVESASMEPASMEPASMESSEMALSEMPSVEMMTASLEDYPATVIGTEVTVVRTFKGTKVRARTNIAAGASA
jgi:hypothetical protein